MAPSHFLLWSGMHLGTIGLVDGLLRRSDFNAGIERRIPLIDIGIWPEGPTAKLDQGLLSTYIRNQSRQGLAPDICSELDLAYEATAALLHNGDSNLSSDSNLGGATVVTMSRRALRADAVADEDMRHQYATPIKNSEPSVTHWRRVREVV
ncbi:hypothetical protein LZ30DRAFT_770958 [Colletotrichum cereale]|nr:hypothetical protein LZ30DRAFT_770958 [Colletotrichum cereale]